MNGRGEDIRIRQLELEVRGDSQVHWVDTPDFPGERGKRDMVPLTITTSEREAIDVLAALLRFHGDLSHPDTSVSDELYADLLRIVGQRLFDLLVVGTLRDQMVQILAAVDEDDDDAPRTLLRIKLSFVDDHVSWLAGLPWEYLHTPSGHDSAFGHPTFLSNNAELMLSRERPRQYGRELGKRRMPVPVLLVCPRPTVWSVPDSNGGQTDLTAGARVDPTAIHEYFQALHDDGRIRLTTLVDDEPDYPVDGAEFVTSDAMRKAIQQDGPVVVHFVGHGNYRHVHENGRYHGRGELLFSDRAGRGRWLRDDDFADAMRRGRVKLVFLQACESGLTDQYLPFSGVAVQVADRGVPAVVGMQYRVKAEVAANFTMGFYDELLVGRSPVDVAVEAGRERIHDDLDVRDRLAFGCPVLYLSSHTALVDDGDGVPGAPEVVPRGHGSRLGLPGTAVERPVASVEACPRCGDAGREESRRCATCGLWLFCSACDKALHDPEKDTYCDQCGWLVERVPWVRRDQVDTGRAPDESATEAAATEVGVISIMGGPQSGTQR